MRKALYAIVLVASLALLAGCGGESLTPSTADLSGGWSGSSEGVTLNLTLSEDMEGNLTGSGSISGETESFSVTVSNGTHSGSSFSMQLDAGEGVENATYSGTVVVSEGTGGTGPSDQVLLDGSLNGSGFNNFQITLSR